MGFPLTESSGNYYFNSSGNGIMLEAVEVYAYSTGMNSSGDGHSGYSSGLGGGDGPLDMVIGYLQNMGFSFSYSNGSYSYHNNNNNNSSSNSNNDPWKRDSNGKIIAERTLTPAFQYDTYGVDMTMEEFELTAQDNTKVKVYKVTSVVDPLTGLPRNPTEAEKANCLGFAMTGDDYWVLDNPSTLGKDEGLITRSDIIGWYGYEVCDKSEASLVVVYDGTNAIHAGIVNADGTYDGIRPTKCIFPKRPAMVNFVS